MTGSWRFALAAAAVAGAAGLAAPARGDVVQTLSIPLTDTNWDPTTGSLKGLDPLVFQQFNPAAHPGETLQAVDISVTMKTSNNFSMTFTAPSTITVSAITPPDPNNPSAVYAPTVAAGQNWPISSFIPSQHVQEATDQNGNPTTLSLTKTVGPGGPFPETFGPSQLGGPMTTNNTFNSQPITSSSPDYSKFVGSGTIAFPFLAQGISTFTSSTANGSGFVQTQAGVTMTIDYVTVRPQTVPEPASLVLLGLGAAGLVAVRLRRPVQ